MFFRLFDKKSDDRLTDKKFDTIQEARLFCELNFQDKNEHNILIVAYDEDVGYVDECSLWCVKVID